MKVYYKSSSPSEASPGTQIGSTNSSTDCQTHSVSVTPGTTISNLYIALIYTKGSGDNYIIFDDLSVTETPTYTITYDPGDGSGSMNPTSGALPLTIDNNGYTRSGYTFTGLDTVKNGSGTAYAAGASYSTAANITLYAQWQASSGIFLTDFHQHFPMRRTEPLHKLLSLVDLVLPQELQLTFKISQRGGNIDRYGSILANITRNEFSFPVDFSGNLANTNLHVRLRSNASNGATGNFEFAGVNSNMSVASLAKSSGVAVVTPVAITDGLI